MPHLDRSEKNQEFLFLIAQQYLELPWKHRFLIGHELEIISEMDIINLNDDELDVLIFSDVVRANKIEKFVQMIYTKAMFT